MNLYNINEQILDCVDMETGEIIDAEKLDTLMLERDAKIESIACWIKNLKAEAEALKIEKQAFAKRQQVAENKMNSLKQYLSNVLQGKKFKTDKVQISFRNTQSVEVSDVYAVADFDDSLVKYAAPVPDKTAIKVALKDGLAVKGAVLKDSLSMTIK